MIANPFLIQEQEHYTKGACMFLTAALHVVFDWEIVYDDLLEIEFFEDEFQTGDHPFGHCYSVVGDQLVDITGVTNCNNDDHQPKPITYPQLKWWMVWEVPACEILYYESLAEAIELVHANYDYFAQFEKGGK